MLYTPIKNLGNNLNQVQFSFMAIDRIFELFDQDTLIKDNNNAAALSDITDYIEYNNVSFSYGERLPQVLNNITFKAYAGTTTAFVGNSGGGKQQ